MRRRGAAALTRGPAVNIGIGIDFDAATATFRAFGWR